MALSVLIHVLDVFVVFFMIADRCRQRMKRTPKMILTLTSLCTGYGDTDSEFVLESEDEKYASVAPC